MKRSPLLAILLVLSLLVILPANGPRAKARSPRGDLGITPRLQQTPVWCWVTVGQMVFEHYDIPNVNPAGNYQCGIIGALAGPQSPCFSNCARCVVPAGSSEAIVNMLSFYPRAVQFLIRRPVRQLSGRLSSSPLSKAQVKEEIDAERPMIVGVNFDSGPRPASQHVALIVGYDEDDDGSLTLTVNDPFPYDLPQFRPFGNPYVKAGGEDGGDGSFTIEYLKFRTGLRWHETIYKIQ